MSVSSFFLHARLFWAEYFHCRASWYFFTTTHNRSHAPWWEKTRSSIKDEWSNDVQSFILKQQIISINRSMSWIDLALPHLSSSEVVLVLLGSFGALRSFEEQKVFFQEIRSPNLGHGLWHYRNITHDLDIHFCCVVQFPRCQRSCELQNLSCFHLPRLLNTKIWV